MMATHQRIVYPGRWCAGHGTILCTKYLGVVMIAACLRRFPISTMSSKGRDWRARHKSQNGPRALHGVCLAGHQACRGRPEISLIASLHALAAEILVATRCTCPLRLINTCKCTYVCRMLLLLLSAPGSISIPIFRLPLLLYYLSTWVRTAESNSLNLSPIGMYVVPG
ncbi:hypothetical protein F5Y15DRAFT_14937 [Xylariaceae sp. FL0016]|nr:hypothetical protein F5Y15DRAFT_14937 [Xylariaceae sp. FL0016]